MQLAIWILLWFSAIAAGLMAGIYYAFSAFIMRSLDALEGDTGMIAMQSINRVILRSSFLPLFFASSASCALLVVAGALDLGAAGAWQMAVGGGAYVAGMLLVTIFGNVPLNDRLDAAAPDTPEGTTMWQLYMRRWVAYNHVRTAACLAAMALLIWSIAERWFL